MPHLAHTSLRVFYSVPHTAKHIVLAPSGDFPCLSRPSQRNLADLPYYSNGWALPFNFIFNGFCKFLSFCNFDKQKKFTTPRRYRSLREKKLTGLAHRKPLPNTQKARSEPSSHAGRVTIADAGETPLESPLNAKVL